MSPNLKSAIRQALNAAAAASLYMIADYRIIQYEILYSILASQTLAIGTDLLASTMHGFISHKTLRVGATFRTDITESAPSEEIAQVKCERSELRSVQ
jgi:hypothetical protein